MSVLTLGERILAQVKYASAFVTADKFLRAYWHICAGLRLWETALEEAAESDAQPDEQADTLLDDTVTSISVRTSVALIYGVLCYIAPYLPHCIYNEEACCEEAVAIFQALYEQTGDEEFKRMRSELIEQQLTKREGEPEWEELTFYLVNAPLMNYYDILSNDDDQLLFSIPTKVKLPGEAKNSMLYYDGGAHALLIKNDGAMAICDFIHPGVRKLLPSAEEILVAEVGTEPGNIQAEYMAEVIYTQDMDCLFERAVKVLEKD